MADIRFNFNEVIPVPVKTGLWVHPDVRINAEQMTISGTYYDLFQDGTMAKNSTDFTVKLTAEDIGTILSIVQQRAGEQGVLRPSTPAVTFDPPPAP